MKKMLLLACLLMGGAVHGATTELRLSEGDVTNAVLDYLDCDECFESEFEYVIYLGPQVAPVLAAARDGDPPFDQILSDRRSRYFIGGLYTGARILGIDPDTSNSGERTRLEAFADSYADYTIQGDRDRYSRKAAYALRRLAREGPRVETGRGTEE